MNEDIDRSINRLKNIDLKWEGTEGNHFTLVAPIFKQMKDYSQQHLIENIETKKFKKGELIFKSGDIVQGAYIVSSGMVEENVAENIVRYGMGGFISYQHMVQ
jgi:signal-transduction protein with cAMP-binding, CBS, and nucleotidyltransferase domain